MQGGPQRSDVSNDNESPRLASWKKYLDVAYPAKPADWDGELARIEAKLSEPGRMKVLQAMCKANPGDAGAQLGNVACPVGEFRPRS